jgi:hypothetical protein
MQLLGDRDEAAELMQFHAPHYRKNLYNRLAIAVWRRATY